jgi:hypothetical protein
MASASADLRGRVGREFALVEKGLSGVEVPYVELVEVPDRLPESPAAH